MKTLKKTLCLVLAVVMAVGVLVLPASAADYKDVTSDTKYAEAINALTKYGIVKGKSTTENVFDPDGDVTRAEVTAMLYRIMTGDTDEKNIKNSESYATKYFPKDKFTAWQLGPVGYSANAGLVKGKYEGFFDPDGKVTGYELLAIMLRAVGYGKNGEYEGALWQQHAIADATQIGFLKSVVGDMKDNLSRGQVAQIIYNAIAAPMVTYYQGAYSAYKDVAGRPVAPNTPGATLNPSLVNYTSTTSAASNAKSVWGIPSATKTETVTFNNVIKTVVVSTTETPVDLKLFETWDAVTECNVIKGIGVDGDHYADTYTNGKYNKGTQKLEALDTVNKIGHEGRHTLVYANPDFDSDEAETKDNPKYLIVYIDTFLATVTKTWEKVTDPAGHIIKAAGANVRVWFNKQARAWEIGTSSYTTSNNYIDLTVDGTYTVGQKLGVNLTTVADESGKTKVINVMAPSLPNKNYKADPVTGKYPAGPQIEVDPTVPASPYTLTKVTATIETITRDSSKGAMNYNYAIGFVAGGTQYFYNNTYIKTVLQGDAVGKTYDIWLDSQGNVLDLALSTPGGGYGVVTNTVVKQVNSKNYVVDYTILLPDGTETTISVGDTNGKAFERERDAKILAADIPEDTLVHYIGTLNYYRIIPCTRSKDDVNMIESGRADAIEVNYTRNPVTGDEYHKQAGDLVNDETVFFVAEYLPNLTTDDNTADYEFQRYTVYTGFKTIPDLGIDAGASLITVQYFVVGDDGEPVRVGDVKTDDYAKYVLVLYSTKQTVPPQALNTVNYAYLITNDVYVQQGRNTYTYGAVVNGEKTTLTFALSKGKTETGLYTYNQSVNGDGYSNLYLLDGRENSSLKIPYNANFEMSKGTYVYNNGVLRCNPTGDLKDLDYFTVDDNCAVYLVNGTTGGVVSTNLSALDVYGKVSSIWYQLNEKGYIDLIYIDEQEVVNVPDGADDTVYPKPDPKPMVGVEDYTTVYDSNRQILVSKEAPAAKIFDCITAALQAKVDKDVKIKFAADGKSVEVVNGNVTMTYTIWTGRNSIKLGDKVIGAIDQSTNGRALSEIIDAEDIKLNKGEYLKVYGDIAGDGEDQVTNYYTTDSTTGKINTGKAVAYGNRWGVELSIVTEIPDLSEIEGPVSVGPGIVAEEEEIGTNDVIVVTAGGTLDVGTIKSGAKVVVEDGGILKADTIMDGTNITLKKGAKLTADTVATGATLTVGEGDATVTNVAGTVTASGSGTLTAGNIVRGGKVEANSTGTVTVGDVAGELDVTGGTVTAGEVTGTAKVAKGTLNADKIAKGSDVTVTVGTDAASSGIVNADVWEEAADATGTASVVTTSNIKTVFAPGVYNMDPKTKLLNAAGQTDHANVLRYDFAEALAALSNLTEPKKNDVKGAIVEFVVNDEKHYYVDKTFASKTSEADQKTAWRFCMNDGDLLKADGTVDASYKVAKDAVVTVNVYLTTGDVSNAKQAIEGKVAAPFFSCSFTNLYAEATEKSETWHKGA